MTSFLSLMQRQGRRLAFTGALIGALVSMHAAAEPALTLKAKQPVQWSQLLGVNAHLLWFNEPAYRTQLSKLKALGLNQVRVDLHWDRLEPQAGNYQLNALDKLNGVLAEQAVAPLYYLVGSAPFASSAPAGAANSDQYPPLSNELYAERLNLLAQRYPQAQWQVWNEPNLPAYWRAFEDPQAFKKLYETSQTKLGDKPAVLGGMAYYSQMPVRSGLMLQSLGDAGALRGKIAAYHPYTAAPEGDQPADKDFLVHGTLLNQYLRSVGAAQIWATEFGWSSYSGPVEEQAIIGEQGQADFLIKRIALMSTMDYQRIYLFALSDLDARATVRDQSYGLLALDGREKPAYQALKRFLQTTGGRLTPKDAPAFAQAPAGMISMAWQRSDGKTLWIFWARENGQVSLPQKAGATLINPLRGTSKALKTSGSVLSVAVTGELQMLLF